MNAHTFVRILFCGLITFLFSANVLAQEPSGKGSITGIITDSVTGQAIDYASIGLLDGEKEVNGTTSDEKGNFTLTGIPEGSYTLVIYFMGYKKGSLANVSISREKPSVNVGTIHLVNLETKLDEVTIVAKTDIIENKIDKIVYNVANDITSQGGAAIDVLKKVPQVSVDIDGNVELQGNSNIRFLINGKPSSIFGSSLADALAAIPASQIKSIEAITSPGAKYDAQGTGGIINIILKENKVKGINGSINLNGGTRFENGAFNLNIKNNNFGVNAFASGNAQLVSHTPNSQNRYSTDAATQDRTHLMQDGYTNVDKNGFRSGLGFDWTINKKNSLTGSVSYNQFSNHNRGFINQEQSVEDGSSVTLYDVKGYRNSDSRSSEQAMDFNLNYLKTFKQEGRELSISFISSYGTPKSKYLQTQSYAGMNSPYAGTSGSNPGTDRNMAFTADYVHPVSKDITIETGVKGSQQDINSTTSVSVLDSATGNYQVNPFQSYHLNYNMDIFAAYVSSTFKVFNWLSVKAGARSEYTHIAIDFPGAVVPSYNIIVPSVILFHKFKKEQILKLSYTRRIERPDYGDLNPFLNLSDPHNITTGNPSLKPEIGDNFELGYSKDFTNGANIYVALGERMNSQDMKQISTFYSTYVVNDSAYTNVSVSSIQNIGKEYNSGLNISGTYPVKDKLKIRGNFSAYNRYIMSTIYVGNINMGLRYRFNLNFSYQLPKDLIVEAFGNYNSAAKNIQGKTPQSVTYTIALRKQFWHKKASFGFTATNPFNTYIKQVTTITTNNYTSYNVRELPYRSIGISFMYRFGKLEFKKSKEDSEFLNVPAPATQN